MIAAACCVTACAYARSIARLLRLVSASAAAIVVYDRRRAVTEGVFGRRTRTGGNGRVACRNNETTPNVIVETINLELFIRVKIGQIGFGFLPSRNVVQEAEPNVIELGFLTFLGLFGGFGNGGKSQAER